MHGHTSAEFGFPGHTAAEFVVERGRRALAEAAVRVPLIAARQQALADTLSSRFAAIGPRQRYGVIHEELGPDHVLVDDAGRPVLIDIEGTMVFDIEWEHAFLELRFGPLYPMLRTLPLDEARMRLCRLTHHLSLVAGPLLLIDGDFPRPDSMREIAEANIPGCSRRWTSRGCASSSPAGHGSAPSPRARRRPARAGRTGPRR
jgi:hypothetical protein